MEKAKFGSELFHKEANIKYLRQTISSEIQKLVLPQKTHKKETDPDEKGRKKDEKSRFSIIDSLYWKLSNFNSNVESNSKSPPDRNTCQLSNEIDSFLNKEATSFEKHEKKNRNSLKIEDYEAETLQKLIFYGCLNDYEFLVQLMAFELFTRNKDSKVLFLFNQADNSIVLCGLTSERETSRYRLFDHPIVQKQPFSRFFVCSVRSAGRGCNTTAVSDLPYIGRTRSCF